MIAKTGNKKKPLFLISKFIIKEDSLLKVIVGWHMFLFTKLDYTSCTYYIKFVNLSSFGNF